MNRSWICERAENCFAENYTYAYLFECPITEEVLEAAGSYGKLEIKRKFRVPCYFLDLEKGIRIKGIVGDNVMKASFPKEDYQNLKDIFEQQLDVFMNEEGLTDGESTK